MLRTPDDPPLLRTPDDLPPGTRVQIRPMGIRLMERALRCYHEHQEFLQRQVEAASLRAAISPKDEHQPTPWFTASISRPELRWLRAHCQGRIVGTVLGPSEGGTMVRVLWPGFSVVTNMLPGGLDIVDDALGEGDAIPASPPRRRGAR